MTVIPAVHAWPSNAHLIADVAALGYIHGATVDLTYGRGNFWKLHRPDDLTAHDLFSGPCRDGVDFTALPEADDTYDTAVFDPPYKLTGTPDPAFAARYGLRASVPWPLVRDLLTRGTAEAVRVTKPGGFALVKCQDQVVSGQVRWQTLAVIDAAAKAQADLVDRFDLLGTARPQPGMDSVRRQRHAHGRPSTLLVFRKHYR